MKKRWVYQVTKPMDMILIVDDDRMFCNLLQRQLTAKGYQVHCAFSLKEGLKKTSQAGYDVILLDVGLPDGNGLEAIPRFKKSTSTPEVIIFTSLGDPDGAELAIKSGAWDYIEKPSSLEKMFLPISRAFQYRGEKKSKGLPILLKREGIIGQSPSIQDCLEKLAQAAASEVDVLLLGETGTGKELFAESIHENSRRAREKFLVVDCASIPENLVESILFGHEKGAFTGAGETREGLIRQADGGTLFLDEIGELPLAIQKSFLRVLQEHRFRPIGSKHEIQSDFRLISATNRDLEAMVREGRFRKDLLFRLRSLIIELPPLRRRPEDLKDIFLFYLAKLSKLSGHGIKGFSPEFFEALNTYPWPGNVRELISALKVTLSAAGEDPVLFPLHLPTYIRVQLTRELIGQEKHPAIKIGGLNRQRDLFPSLKQFKEINEKQYLDEVLTVAKQDIQKALKLSGLSRSRFYALLKKHQIS
jgi:two-component system NtrC family response regulator